MIIDALSNAEKYASLHPRFAAAFEFLRRSDIADLPPGRVSLDGDDLFAMMAKAEGRARADVKLESHRKYIDIQFVISGTDEMGWKPVSACHESLDEYSAAKDIQFFNDRADAWIATPAGSFCIFFPGDAHAPLVSEGAIHKAIVKVAV